MAPWITKRDLDFTERVRRDIHQYMHGARRKLKQGYNAKLEGWLLKFYEKRQTISPRQLLNWIRKERAKYQIIHDAKPFRRKGGGNKKPRGRK